jgi:site-specific DNA recombinase
MASARVSRLRKKAVADAQTRQETCRRALGYVRVSTDEQATTGHGMAAQEKAIAAFAVSQGYELVGIVADPGISGTTRPESRPGFTRVLALAGEGAFSVLLVWKFDRLARHLTFAVTTANALREQHNVVLRSVTEPIDTATAMGEMIFAVLSGMAQQEHRAISERTMAGKREKASIGGFTGGPAPYGYATDHQGGLVLVPEEAEVVRRIFAEHQAGWSLHRIADRLKADQVPTRRGGQWWAATVKYVLENVRYRGRVEYYFAWNGEELVEREGSHPAILGQGAAQ